MLTVNSLILTFLRILLRCPPCARAAKTPLSHLPGQSPVAWFQGKRESVVCRTVSVPVFMWTASQFLRHVNHFSHRGVNCEERLAIQYLMKRITGTPRFERLCLYIAWALYAAPTLAILAWSLRVRPPRTTAAILMTFVLTAGLVAAVTRSWRRFFLYQFPICLLGVAFVTYTVAFGIPPGTTLASILAGASWEELEGFIDMPQARWLVMLLVAWSGCYLVSAWISPTRPILIGRGILLRIGVLLVPAAVYAASNPAELIDGIALEPIVGSVMFMGGDIPRVGAEIRDAQSHKIPYRA